MFFCNQNKALLNKLAVLVFAAVLMSCSSLDEQQSSMPSDIYSVKEILQDKSKYAGKEVSVRGTLAVGFEHCAIWPSGKAYDQKEVHNVIWVDYPDSRCTHPSLSYRDTEKVDSVVVTGKFNPRNGGHLGIFEGALEGVQVRKLDGSKLDRVNGMKVN